MKSKNFSISRHIVLLVVFATILSSNPALSQSNSEDTKVLKQTLKEYMAKVDSGKYLDAIPYYDSSFLSIRDEKVQNCVYWSIKLFHESGITLEATQHRNSNNCSL